VVAVAAASAAVPVVAAQAADNPSPLKRGNLFGGIYHA